MTHWNAPSLQVSLTERTRLQLEQISQDRPSRILAQCFAYLCSLLMLQSVWTLVFFAINLALDLAVIPLERRLLAGKGDPRSGMGVFLAVCAAASVMFCAIPVFVILQGGVPEMLFGLVVLWAAITHCVVMRTLDPWIFGVSVMPAALSQAAVLPAIWQIETSPLRMAGLASVTIIASVYVASAALSGFQLNRNLLDARRKADDANSAKDRFLAMISHEVRTPLNGILGIAQLQRSDARSDAEIRDADVLLSSGMMLKSIVDDVLDHAKMETGRFTITSENTDLRKTLETVRRLFAGAAQERGLSLDVVVAADVPGALVLDPLRLKQILSNLISNAIKFTDHGSVRVEARRVAREGDDRIEVEVSDTGAGIPADALERLFTPYQQLDTAAARAGVGTGLGLVIARNLARLMDGDLTVRSTLGAGTAFSLSLPERRTEPVAASAEPGEVPGSSLMLDGTTILVVDDNATNRMVARAFLKRDGATVVEAADGREALDILGGDRIDLVLMDIQMPVMSGDEVVRQMRRDAVLVTVPVIALTAAASHGDRESCAEEGFDGFLSKPLARTSLRTEIERVMTARAPLRHVIAERPSFERAPH